MRSIKAKWLGAALICLALWPSAAVGQMQAEAEARVDELYSEARKQKSLGNIYESIEVIKEAIRISNQHRISDKNRLALLNHLLGVNNIDLKKYSEAEKNYRKLNNIIENTEQEPKVHYAFSKELAELLTQRAQAVLQLDRYVRHLKDAGTAEHEALIAAAIATAAQTWGDESGSAVEDFGHWLARIPVEERVPWMLDLVCDHLTYITHIRRSGLHCGELERTSDVVHPRDSVARARMHMYLGWHQQRRGYTEDALVRFRYALQIMSRHDGYAAFRIRAQTEIARMHAFKKRYETARDLLTEIVHGPTPSDAEGKTEKFIALHLLGFVHWKLNDQSAAIEAMRDVIDGLTAIRPELSGLARSALARASAIADRQGLRRISDIIADNESKVVWQAD